MEDNFLLRKMITIMFEREGDTNFLSKEIQIGLDFLEISIHGFWRTK